MKGHAGAPAVALSPGGKHDGINQSEEDGVVNALRWRVECLGGFALIEVVDQAAGDAAAVTSRHLARHGTPWREVAVRRTTATGFELNEIENAPRNEHPAVAVVINVDPFTGEAVLASSVGQDDGFAVEQRYERGVR